MKNKIIMNLQLFADGGEGGSGVAGQGARDAGNGNGGQGNAGATYSFEQAEEIANARAMRAEQAALRSYFQQQGMTEEEAKQALAQFRQQREANKPNVSAIEKERDTALAKVAQYENEKVLSSKGVKSEDLDYVMFKVSQLVTDKKDFKTVADEYLKENPRYTGVLQGTYRVSTGTPSGSGVAQTPNETINDAIRNAFRKR